MRPWRQSPKDLILLLMSIAQLAVMLILAWKWDTSPLPYRIAAGVLLTSMITYNIIVISHVFTHVAWFVDDRLNAVVSVINSINIGQSVQAYEFSHVRNHHRYNNDRQGPDGSTRDTSSTYRHGRNGQHESLATYALRGAVESVLDRAKALASITRLFTVGPNEHRLLALASRTEPRRTKELHLVQADRAADCLALIVFALLSWRWVVLCYFPASFVGLTLVNVQNYYRHYGANPNHRSSDSVSHYNRIYNALTFNDGYHQEHHLKPRKHWSQMRDVRRTHRESLDSHPRIVSPVPALVGFLDRRRPLLQDLDDTSP